MVARKPLAPKAPKLAVVKDDKPKPPPPLRPNSTVVILADAVKAGEAQIEDMQPVEGQPGLVDIRWKTRKAGSTLRTSRQAANQRVIAA